MPDAHAVMRAFAKASPSRLAREENNTRKPTIIVSRSMGCGGDAIARRVAERLGLDVYGREVLDTVAKQAKVDTTLMAGLNEMAKGGAWLYATVFGKNVARQDYLKYLVATVRGFYRMGGVIMGRGSFIILEGRDVFRVRLYGSPEACARRVAEEDGIDLDSARRKVEESNRKREKFVTDMFGRRLTDTANFDLMINTDLYPDFDAVVDTILSAFGATGIQEKLLGFQANPCRAA